MKIIISHDVDHLYTREHIFRDLIFPKMIVRSFIYFIKRKISFKTLIARIFSICSRRMNRIEEVMCLDKEYDVPSTFFFGMNQGLGMSYYPEEAEDTIIAVRKKGFDVGVHGINYQNFEAMKAEYEKFASIIQEKDFGIRMHYVRFDNDTFEKLEEIGYIYDTTEFNKKELEVKNPHKVGKMWEFPLCIMDGYIIPPENLEEGIKNTINAIKLAEKNELPYCTILFHDFQYNEKAYPVEKAWYDWVLKYLKKENYEFISYREAMEELEKNRR